MTNETTLPDATLRPASPHPLSPRQMGMMRHLSDQQWARLAPAMTERVTALPDTVLSTRGKKLDYSLLLLDGLVARSVPRADHDRSTFVALQFPGDFVDLHAFPLKKLDHDIVALTPSELAVIRHEKLTELLNDDVELARVLWSLTLVDAAIHRHWVMRNSSMRAFGRVANFLSEFDARMTVALGEERDRYPLAITQADIADATGVTKVHVSRTLRDLREDECCAIRNGTLEIICRDRLRKRGEFDASYLYFPEPFKTD
ncbi:Crp/Fnr family transcriptional regulator [Thalassorhabdomicrobium marinisediminis]|uniref:Crp/Fnr family transcriptional regulator n=1 Tax=Thalassorhabdomicrobium marinisediminis TaxID=2170577 RepID=UPI00248F9DF0|nr:Crp/Fnr family transcriptional regulator [Thalassorhabdomicrobium marinisediminis]